MMEKFAFLICYRVNAFELSVETAIVIQFCLYMQLPAGLDIEFIIDPFLKWDPSYLYFVKYIFSRSLWHEEALKV